MTEETKRLERNVHEALNNGLSFKFYVAAEECPGIESFVKTDVTVKFGDELKLNGSLEGVKSWVKKEKGEVVGIYKELYVLVENLIADDGCFIQLPDKKSILGDIISVEYGRRD